MATKVIISARMQIQLNTENKHNKMTNLRYLIECQYTMKDYLNRLNVKVEVKSTDNVQQLSLCLTTRCYLYETMHSKYLTESF